MSDATLFTAMYVSEFIGMIKQSIKECVREEFKQLANSPVTPQEELLTIEQAAHLLHISKVTIHKMKKKGNIPFYRMGRRIMFKKHELIHALKSSNTKIKNV